jgi:hypothetical protein
MRERIVRVVSDLIDLSREMSNTGTGTVPGFGDTILYGTVGHFQITAVAFHPRGMPSL